MDSHWHRQRVVLPPSWRFPYLMPRIALAFLLPVCGCGSGVEDGKSFDSAGIRVRVAIVPDKPVPWRTALLRTIRGSGGQEDRTVERPGQVATDGAERVYLVDAVNASLSAYDDEGRKLWERGRAGGGPGEFRFPSFLRVAESGTVQVTDQGKGSVVQYDRNGSVLPEIPFAAHGYPHSALYLSGDTVIIHEMDPSAWVLRIKYQARITELARAPIVTLGRAKLRCSSRTLTINGAPRFFSPNVVWSVARGKVVAANESQYEIRGFEQGGLRTIVRRDVSTRSTTPADLDRLYPNGTWIGRPDCKTDSQTLITLFGMEPHLPLLKGILVAPDQGVWVERYTFPDEEPRVDVWDAQGSYQGTAVGIGRPIGFLAGGRFVALIYDDSLGVYRVGIFQIKR
jgi:hypothetical protein